MNRNIVLLVIAALFMTTWYVVADDHPLVERAKQVEEQIKKDAKENRRRAEEQAKADEVLAIEAARNLDRPRRRQAIEEAKQIREEAITRAKAEEKAEVEAAERKTEEAKTLAKSQEKNISAPKVEERNQPAKTATTITPPNQAASASAKAPTSAAARSLDRGTSDCPLPEIVRMDTPPYCNYNTLMSDYKIKNKMPTGIQNAHAFKINGKVVVGLAVGHSDTTAVKNLPKALGISMSSDEQKFCTWYFNDGNDQAANAFHHVYFDRPTNQDKALREIPPLINGQMSLWQKCLKDSNYLAMGCDGQRHRGPSAFGMFLTVAGCEPEQAEYITCRLWKMNGISHDTRKGLNKMASIHGNLKLQVTETTIDGLALDTRAKQFQHILGDTSETSNPITPAKAGVN